MIVCASALVTEQFRDQRIVEEGITVRARASTQRPLLSYWTLLVTYCKPQWPGVMLLAALLFGSISLEIINPQLIRAFIDSAIAGSSLQSLLLTGLIFLGASLAQQAIGVGTTYMSEQVGWIATNQLRSDVTRHCLQLDLAFHHAHTPGEMIERLDGDLTILSNFFSEFILRLLGSGLLLLGILLALFHEDWRVGLVLTGFSLGTLFLLNRFRSLASPHWLAGRQASAALFSLLEEYLSGLNDLRANGASQYSLRRLHQALREHVLKRRRARMTSEVILTASAALLALGYVGALALGAALFEGNQITLGAVYLIGYYISLLLDQLRQISLQIDNLQQAAASIERVRALYQTTSTIQDGPGAALPPGALAVEFQQVSFGYEPEHLVLQDISFRLEPGRILGVLGRTGSGKTTIARLLSRLYDPAIGSVLLGGIDAREAHLADLWQHVGLVTQDVQLFQATLRDNLTFFDRSIPDTQIIAALRLLGLSDWYAALPAGLESEIGSGGAGLSAGEAQLLAFARVFLKNPGLVILDEASAHLDPATERRIDQAIGQLLQQRTGLIIAHRLATVQRADDILILEQGRIVEYGSREQLAHNPTSRFYQLLRVGEKEARV